MGFDWQKIRLLKNSFAMRELSFVSFTAREIQITSNENAWRGSLDAMTNTFEFRPHFGWTGAIEKQNTALSA